MELLYSFAVALFLTIALIPLLIKFSGRLQLLDDPSDPRKVHVNAIPRSGGLAISLGVFVPILLLMPIQNEFMGLVWGAGIITLFGYLDDRYELDVKWKFFGQILAILVAIYGGVTISQVPLMGFADAPAWIVYPLTFFFILGVTNAVNLSDGLDGLAAGTTMLTLGFLAIFALRAENDSGALVAITVIGGLLGFLRYNTFPARIFMGDTGSQFLGYMGASLAIIISQDESNPISPVIPLVVLGLPVLDTLNVMFIRIREGRSPFSPDKNHLHHQLMALGFRHYEAVGIIYIAQVALLAVLYVLSYSSDILLLCIYLLFCITVIGLLSYGKRSNWLFRQPEPVGQGERPERRNTFLRRFHWLYQYSPRIIEASIALFLIVCAFLVTDISTEFSQAALFLAALVFILAYVFRHIPQFVARLACYSASVFVIYLFTQAQVAQTAVITVNIYLALLVAFLVLAIRMTRREDFRLDTQDLLVLLIVLIIPQLPFETLSANSIGEIALRLAVLMYSCEFLLGRSDGQSKVLLYASITSLVVIGLS